MATLHYSRDSGGRSTAVLAFELNSDSIMEEGSVCYTCLLRAKGDRRGGACAIWQTVICCRLF